MSVALDDPFDMANTRLRLSRSCLFYGLDQTDRTGPDLLTKIRTNGLDYIMCTQSCD